SAPALEFAFANPWQPSDTSRGAMVNGKECTPLNATAHSTAVEHSDVQAMIVSIRFSPNRGSIRAFNCDPQTRQTAQAPKISPNSFGVRPNPISNTGEQPDKYANMQNVEHPPMIACIR